MKKLERYVRHNWRNVPSVVDLSFVFKVIDSPSFFFCLYIVQIEIMIQASIRRFNCRKAPKYEEEKEENRLMKITLNNYLWVDERLKNHEYDSARWMLLVMCVGKIEVAHLCCFCHPTTFDHHNFHTICNY